MFRDVSSINSPSDRRKQSKKERSETQSCIIIRSIRVCALCIRQLHVMLTIVSRSSACFQWSSCLPLPLRDCSRLALIKSIDLDADCHEPQPDDRALIPPSSSMSPSPNPSPSKHHILYHFDSITRRSHSRGQRTRRDGKQNFPVR
jgi:hypothetical protein